MKLCPRALATSCDFGQMESEMIRDQLISKSYRTAVKDNLLLEDDLTLDKAQRIAEQVKAVVKNTTLLSSARTVPTAQVHAIGTQNTHFWGRRVAHPAKSSALDQHQSKSVNVTQRKCFRCGSTRHLANDKNCPAASVKCNSCGKLGHFAKVCKSPVSEVREIVVPELSVFCVDDIEFLAEVHDKITCTVNIEAPRGNFHVLEHLVSFSIYFTRVNIQTIFCWLCTQGTKS